jgi:PiT family inorganic phosphate transporter
VDPILLNTAIIVAVALLFDFSNGFHDAANAVATVISTRVLKPYAAVLMAAFFNVVGALTGTAVAFTIAKGIAAPKLVTPEMILAALLGAITWNVLTWWFGLPSSSSHALIGGLVGTVLAGVGARALEWSGLTKTLVALFTSPIVGFLVGYAMMTALYWIFKDTSRAKVKRTSKWMQLVSASFMAFSHGSNDAQKTMGVITLVLMTRGYITGDVMPRWVIFAAAAAMGLGSWSEALAMRLIKTLGFRIARMQPINGFAAETSAATTILVASHLGAPVSTTHVISSAIMGVGAAKRIHGVRWTVIRNIFMAWYLTLPACGALAAAYYLIMHAIMPAF